MAESSMSNQKKRLSEEHIKVLDSEFRAFGSKLPESRKNQLSEKLGISQRKIENWFQNRRVKDKKKRVNDEKLELLIELQRIKEKNEALKSHIHQLQAELWKLRTTKINEENEGVTGIQGVKVHEEGTNMPLMSIGGGKKVNFDGGYATIPNQTAFLINSVSQHEPTNGSYKP